ncbi:MAG: Fe3+-siderophores ABC transporter protein [Proteobacteria bacterium]|nr:MAG: Fe3+-siderophores ABC transporter protein [Pseudomonadota bacterium]
MISLVPSWTETLLACGVEVVGRTRFCVHPDDSVRQIAVVGGTKELSWRKVDALEADLLLLDKEENTRKIAEASPIPFHATHVTGVERVAEELDALAERLEAPRLTGLAERWRAVAERPSLPDRDPAELPGVMSWVRKPKGRRERLLYLIWYRPWMAVAPQTFIGSVLARLGFGAALVPFEQRYPEVDLEAYDPDTTLLCCSSEPFPFARREALIRDTGFPAAIVDGERFSWFGLRSLRFLERELGL